MKKSLMIVAAFGLLGSLTLVGTTLSQVSVTSAKSTPQAAPNSTARFVEFKPGAAGIASPSEIGQLMNQLADADDDTKKAELTKQLETAVAKQFDADLKNRETELTKLEERLTKLRAQLDRRRKAKGEIIQLQIKVLVNEAEGLGFSGVSGFDLSPFPGAFGPMYGAPVGFGGAGAGTLPQSPRFPLSEDSVR